MAQYGFLIDLSRCIGCNACLISCKQWHDIPPGPIKWMRVYQWEKGAFPDIELRILPIPCFHCENPVCTDACPNHAIYKEESWGAVLVDYEKCTGTRECWRACPYGAPQFESDQPGTKMSKCNMCIDRLQQGLTPICVLSCSMRALEFGPIDELMEKYGNLRLLEDMPKKDYAPCRIACPAGFSPEGYIKLISQGKFKEALELFREETPFVGVLGRTCNHPCEIDCTRGQFDNAIAICSLKRYIADKELEASRERIGPVITIREERIAIVGSGPAGLTCAHDLARQGYVVTVFEAASQSGGLMRSGIPQYRLPKQILDNEIGYIEELGVEIKTNKTIRDLNEIFNNGYKAAFIAGGAWLSQRLNIPNENSKGVLYALDFLRQVNMGGKVSLGEKVIVVGGGSVAIDTARTSIRLGAKEVNIVCLECRIPNSKDKMLAQDLEIEEAEEEGVIINPCLGVKMILVKDGKVTCLETISCISVRDEDGMFAPKFAEGSSPIIEADSIIIAIGQSIDKSMVPGGLGFTSTGTISVDPVTLQTSDKRVFAGGDVTTGPIDIISAIAAGKEAAISIDRFIKGHDLRKDRHIPVRSMRERVEIKSIRPLALEVGHREAFIEVELSFDKEAATEQANRCLACGTTVPSVVFKRETPKKKIIPWDSNKAIDLWQKRHPNTGEQLPDIFTDISDVIQDSGDIRGRKNLILKAKNIEEFMNCTTDDE
ncbi:FAD-dependent oxidoreductase [Chloroflexota bacterium]